jgi:hypothetical protein
MAVNDNENVYVKLIEVADAIDELASQVKTQTEALKERLREIRRNKQEK